MRCFPLAQLVVLGLMACDEPDPSPDRGTGTDQDAACPCDGGPPADGGAREDAGPVSDAGPGADGVAPADAADPRDAVSPADLVVLPDAGPRTRIECLETVTGDLCGVPEKIIPGEIVGRPERMMLSRPGPMLAIDGLGLSLVGVEKMIKGQAHDMAIVVQNDSGTTQELLYAYDVNSDPESQNFLFFGRAVVTDPADAVVHHEGRPDEYFSLPVAASGRQEIRIRVTPTKEYFYNETKSYLVFRVLDSARREISAVTLSARVEPPPGAPGSVACGASTFPLVFTNDNGSGPFGAFNRGYSTGICCAGVFYPMAECCLNSDCAAGRGCVDGLCVEKPGATPRFKGAKRVLVGYGLNAENACTVVDPATGTVPADVLETYDRVDRFFNGMAAFLMDHEDGFVHFDVALHVMLPAAMRNAVSSPADIEALMGLYCPDIDLTAYDLVALDNNVSAAWATGFAFPGTNMAIYSHVGLNISTAVHEIAHLYGCRDFYLDLSGSLQWFDSLYGDGRYGRINLALDAPDPDAVLSILDAKVLNGCRGFLGWADSDENGLFDVDEP